MNQKKKLHAMAIIMMLFLTAWTCNKDKTIHAAAKTYGLLIGNAKGQYTYYDLNGAKGTQKIERASNGTVMLPVKKVCSYMPDILYEYNWSTSKATVLNKKNGKRIVISKGSPYITTYSSASKTAKAKKVKLSAKSCLSVNSNALMMDVKGFKYVLAKPEGFQYYAKATAKGKKALADGYYNGKTLDRILVLNPYKEVKALPKATVVKYVSEKDLSNVVKVTICEGYSVGQIGDLMVNKGVCQSTRAFTNATNAVNASEYVFLAGVQKSKKRCFYLEGYLYPSTYEFYKNTSPAEVIRKILKNTEKQYTTTWKKRAQELGYTFDQVLTIASIIEKEVSVSKEQPFVSSVLHNRLKTGMKIQCDATRNYVERYIKPYILGDVNRFSAYYNTYKCGGLPSGPICNPGSKAITAALYPKKTNYYFFCSAPDGTYYYAESYEEHLKNVEKIKQK